MYNSYSMEIGGKTFTVEIGRVRAQANGARCSQKITATMLH